jgi:hypothetical protein
MMTLAVGRVLDWPVVVKGGQMATLTLRPSFKHGLSPHDHRIHSTTRPAGFFSSKGSKVGITLSLVALGLVSIVAPMLGDPTPRLLSYEAVNYGSQALDHASQWEPVPSLLMPTFATDEWNRIDTGGTDESLSGAEEDTSDFDAVVTMPPLEVVAGGGFDKR